MHHNLTRNHRCTAIGSLVDDALHYLDHYDGRGSPGGHRARRPVSI